MLDRLAIGPSSDVVLASDDRDETVVVKRFRAREVSAGAFDATLSGAAIAYSELSHPLIVPLLDFFPSGDQFLVIRRHVEGLSLKQLSSLLRWTGQPLDSCVALYIAEQVFVALAAAHAADTVHGSLYPANVLLSWDGQVLVSDFCLGSAARASGRPPSERADVFAASVMLWELLSGRRARDTKVRPDLVAGLDVDSPVCEVLRFGIDRRQNHPWLGAELMARVLRGGLKEDRARALLVMALDEVRPSPGSEAPASSRHGDRPSSSMAAYSMIESAEPARTPRAATRSRTGRTPPAQQTRAASSIPPSR